MGKNSRVIAFGLFACLIIGFSFYWYEVRPTQIAKNCRSIAAYEAAEITRINKRAGVWEYDKVLYGNFLVRDAEFAFQRCLQTNGLNL